MYIASLPWYDFSEIKHATDFFWCFLADRLRDLGFEAPNTLTRNIPYKNQWQSSRLLFSQACGYDVVKPFIKNLRVVATPCYDVPGCKEHNYASFIIVHRDSNIYNIEQLYNKSCAINCQHSHSGANILYFVIANTIKKNQNFFSQIEYSGSHENSVKMVLDKQVDTAAIDCVSYHILEKFRPEFIKKIRIIFHSPYAPAPPYVTSALRCESEIKAIRQVLIDLNSQKEIQPTLNTLFIREIKYIPLEEYFTILDMEKIAMNKHGFSFLDFA
ncbi:phosphate/phosphite/phosphonate ABC transporter substrate-binding protein [Candidatus Uabimicrobium sp. HlEnr_7]|uniref:phosphate/phosphite/phosphonate ABC transporter substrate-binding protein n=1 Tax=Candidatus Uabimicrobium helgolandensis TaxID=3095367 RepID=UPI0035571C9F